jgi:hypothetical protein
MIDIVHIRSTLGGTNSEVVAALIDLVSPY